MAPVVNDGADASSCVEPHFPEAGAGDAGVGNSGSVRRRHSQLTKYGNAFQPPVDNEVYYPKDDEHSFFASGRDFESIATNHVYTAEERATLSTYESLEYMPSQSRTYRLWLQRQPRHSSDWDRWLMMSLIGVTVGLLGSLLHQAIDLLAESKWDEAERLLRTSGLAACWAFVLGFSVLAVLLAAGLVVLLRPSAAGSGLPELIGFLNGTLVRHIFNVKTLAAKFLSCALAVGGGLPVGPEGPMIHMGSLVGAGLSQFKSDTLRLRLPFFERFRNPEDRRNFISAGAAAGVASAFGAPVGGLLFSMEEVSSFWNHRLSWQTFTCCMLATVTTDVLNSAFHAFEYRGDFGLLKTENYIIFQVHTAIQLNVLAFLPTLVIGVLGGLLGALFTVANLKLARQRRRWLALAPSAIWSKMLRLAEPLLLMSLFASLSVFLPAAFPCRSKVASAATPAGIGVERSVSQYTCANGSYNEMASLLFLTGERAIHHLFSRNSHLEFGAAALLIMLVLYFAAACWAAGCAVASGLVVPMLLIGALYGRLIGLAMVSLFGLHTAAGSAYWAWMDPGAFALIGAASFFGGVSRLTMSLTVIMMEITNDVQFLLPIMVSIMVAKWVADRIAHPFYHALLELKCIPFLDNEAVVTLNAERVNLELFCAGDVMAQPVRTLATRESVASIAELLLSTQHGGFPVVRANRLGGRSFAGFVSRLELLVLLKQDRRRFLRRDAPPQVAPTVDFAQLTLDKLENPDAVTESLKLYVQEPEYQELFLDLHLYMNQSAVSVPQSFSLNRAYIIYRTLGLRHLTIVDDVNCVVGIITRKDLMGFNIEERLAKAANDVASFEPKISPVAEEQLLTADS